ncbi:hypothetical protein ACN38_g5071 [Penicillium nordicum]|uniref:Uncharacterized protein n=1 Tax=Penicillium nordicum TaxID=229535 RepID=A0A0M9WGI2_9EURO|nr:hypothetical protein ACN38_g5071 [Penicillium nordicum]
MQQEEEHYGNDFATLLLPLPRYLPFCFLSQFRISPSSHDSCLTKAAVLTPFVQIKGQSHRACGVYCNVGSFCHRMCRHNTGVRTTKVWSETESASVHTRVQIRADRSYTMCVDAE